MHEHESAQHEFIENMVEGDDTDSKDEGLNVDAVRIRNNIMM